VAGLSSIVQDTFLELDSQIQQTLLDEIKKRPQLEASVKYAMK
jgi:hypothetical protein